MWVGAKIETNTSKRRDSWAYFMALLFWIQPVFSNGLRPRGASAQFRSRMRPR